MAIVATPSITRVACLSLVTADATATEAFFVAAFDAVVVNRREGDPAFSVLMGVPEARVRQTILKIGVQNVALLAFDPPGRPYPSDSTSSDLWFQHFAIIVSDMAAAWERLQEIGHFVPISEGGPQILPPEAGAVTAFKFRDTEGHPLEFLAFPEGKEPETWQRKRGAGLFLGIDHSAIAVGDTQESIAFFEEVFGLSLGAQSENQGPAQERMDAVRQVRVTVSGMMPKVAPPHIELLGYKVGDRRPIEKATRSNDSAATHFVLETDDVATIAAALDRRGAEVISPGIVTLADGSKAIMACDPDGHRFVVVQTAA